MFDLSGRTALVTGGARGLGLAMAEALGAHGARIMLFDSDPVTLEAGLETLRAATIDAAMCIGDVTVPADTVRAVDEMRSRWDRVDIALCNAGVSADCDALDVDLTVWNRTIGVNLAGVFFTAQACGRAMIVQGRGSIIAIASMSGSIVNVPQNQSVYNISKAGVVMAVKSLASEWAEHNVRVNAIAPGYMHTAMTERSLRDPARGGVWMAGTPMKRPGQPSELGGAAVYLASDASSFMTGHTLIIDGGYTLR